MRFLILMNFHWHKPSMLSLFELLTNALISVSFRPLQVITNTPAKLVTASWHNVVVLCVVFVHGIVWICLCAIKCG